MHAMKRSLRILAALGAATLLAAPAWAQTPTTPLVLVGGGIGVTAATESASVPVIVGSGECGTFESGNGIAGSLDARLVLPTFFAPSLGFDSRLRIGYAMSELTAAPTTPTVVRDADGGELVELEREFRLERSAVTVALDLLVRASIERLHLAAGLAIGTRIAPSFEQTDNIVGPGAQSFDDGQPSRPMPLATDETSPLSIAPVITAGYALPIGTGAYLVPEIGARFEVTSSTADGSWRSTEIFGGIAILFDATVIGSPITPGTR
jgi:hypothetical protein